MPPVLSRWGHNPSGKGQLLWTGQEHFNHFISTLCPSAFLNNTGHIAAQYKVPETRIPNCGKDHLGQVSFNFAIQVVKRGAAKPKLCQGRWRVHALIKKVGMGQFHRDFFQVKRKYSGCWRSNGTIRNINCLK